MARTATAGRAPGASERVRVDFGADFGVDFGADWEVLQWTWVA